MSLTIDFSRSINPAFLIATPSIPQKIQKVIHKTVPLLNAYALSRSTLSYVLLAAHVKDLAQESMDVLLGKKDWDEIKLDVQKTAFAVCHLALSIWYPYLYLIGSETLELIAHLRKWNETSSVLQSTADIFLQSLYLISLVRESPTWQENFQALMQDVPSGEEGKSDLLDEKTRIEVGPAFYVFQQILRGMSFFPLTFRKIKDLEQYPIIITILVLIGRVIQSSNALMELLKPMPRIADLQINWVKQIALVAVFANYSAKYVTVDLLKQLAQLFENTLLIAGIALPVIQTISVFPNLWTPWEQKNYRIGASGSAVKIEDVVGCEEAKKSILKLIDQLTNREKYEKLGPVQTLKGILFFGPPGTGKSMLAKAFANAVGAANFLEQPGASFVNIYIGSGAKNIRSLFNKATLLANENSNRLIVVFIDEINAIAIKRTASLDSAEQETNSTTEAFLTEMDKVPSNVIVIGATNRHPNDLDSAFIRSGRFDQHIEFKLPTKQERKTFFRKLISKYKIHSNIGEEFYERIANQTDEWNYADFDNLVKQAASTAGYQELNEISESIFENCLESLKKQKNNLSPNVSSMYV